MERKITGYEILIRKAIHADWRDVDSRDSFLVDTLEEAISHAFRLWYERFPEKVAILQPLWMIAESGFTQLWVSDTYPGQECLCNINVIYEDGSGIPGSPYVHPARRDIL